MRSQVHDTFSQSITSICDVPSSYLTSYIDPDSDYYNWYRYKNHRLSHIPSLLPIINYSTILPVVGHLYIDMLTGPLKVFSGVNITIHSLLLSLLNETDVVETIQLFFKINSTDIIDTFLKTEFDKLPKGSPKDYINSFIFQLYMNTYGYTSLKKESSLSFIDYPILSNTEIVNALYKMEANIFSHIRTLRIAAHKHNFHP